MKLILHMIIPKKMTHQNAYAGRQTQTPTQTFKMIILKQRHLIVRNVLKEVRAVVQASVPVNTDVVDPVDADNPNHLPTRNIQSMF